MKRHADLLTTDECAAFLGVSEYKIRQWRKRAGHPLPSFMLDGLRWYLKPDVERWLLEEAHGTATAAPTPMRRAG